MEQFIESSLSHQYIQSTQDFVRLCLNYRICKGIVKESDSCSFKHWKQRLEWSIYEFLSWEKVFALVRFEGMRESTVSSWSQLLHEVWDSWLLMWLVHAFTEANRQALRSTWLTLKKVESMVSTSTSMCGRQGYFDLLTNICHFMK
jgi:enoyl-[acyl-carrier-protein] reductase (NADH)